MNISGWDDLVRPAFMRADPAAVTVTGIAIDHGFWELGRFSVEYRALFGESPFAAPARLADCTKSSFCFARGGICIA